MMFGGPIFFHCSHVTSKSLLKQLKHIKEELSKPIADLRNFPALIVAGFVTLPHSDLKSLKANLHKLKEHLKLPTVYMKDKEGKVPVLLSEIETLIQQIESYCEKFALSTKHKLTKMMGLIPMRNLDPDFIPPEIWRGILFTLSYQDKLNCSRICKTLRGIVIEDEANFFSPYTLVHRRGFFSQSIYKLSSVVSAYQKSAIAAASFKEDSKKFRASFQQALIDDEKKGSSVRRVTSTRNT